MGMDKSARNSYLRRGWLPPFRDDARFSTMQPNLQPNLQLNLQLAFFVHCAWSASVYFLDGRVFYQPVFPDLLKAARLNALPVRGGRCPLTCEVPDWLGSIRP